MFPVFSIMFSCFQGIKELDQLLSFYFVLSNVVTIILFLIELLFRINKKSAEFLANGEI
jgi:hypothetical protein